MVKKYNSAREIAQAISRGELPAQHLGWKSFEVCRQELFSMKNSYNPTTMDDEELGIWNTRMANLMKYVAENFDEGRRNQLEKEVDKMLNP